MDAAWSRSRGHRDGDGVEQDNREEVEALQDVPDIGGDAVAVVNPVPGAVEFALQELQKDMGSMLSMQVSIMQKVTKLETSLQLMQGSRKSLAEYSLECKTCEKLKDITKIPDAELEGVVGPYAVSQMVQLFCVIGTSSFALQAENARWMVPEETISCFAADELIIKGGTGLAALFFGVRNNLKRLKFGSGVGRFLGILDARGRCGGSEVCQR